MKHKNFSGSQTDGTGVTEIILLYKNMSVKRAKIINSSKKPTTTDYIYKLRIKIS